VSLWHRVLNDKRAPSYQQLVGQVNNGHFGMWMRDGSDIVNIKRPLLTADEAGNRSFKDVRFSI
jgi:hypothetical protein